MANKEFKIQSDTISLNGVSLSSSVDGKVVIPGVTRGSSFRVDEVKDRDGEEYQFSETITVIDYVTYQEILNQTGDGSSRADYITSLDDELKIDEIEVGGSGTYTAQEAADNASNDMYAYIGTSSASDRPIVPEDWIQIPYRPKMKANSVESDLGGGGNANTGSITFEDNNIIGAGEDSGDGSGYDTIRLVPDADLIENDQYLVIDPTAPSHIHIRAGGTQDASNADLFLGGEKTHVKVRDNQGVRIQNERLSENFYYYSDTASFTNGGWYQENGNWYVEFTTTDQTMISHFWEFTNGGQNRIVLNQNDTLEYSGSASNYSPDVYKVQVNTGPLLGVQPVGTIEFQLFTTETNNIILENGDFRVDVYDDIRMFGRDIFRLVNYSIEEPIEITTDYNNNSYTWSFNPTGSLRLPGGAEINSTNNNIELTVGTSTYTFSYDQMVGSSLQIPGSIQGSAQTSFLSSNGLGISIDGFNSPNTVDIGNIPSSTVLRLKDGNGVGNIVVQALGTSLKLQTNNNSTWEFNDNSGLTFPDNTVQTTAYQGNILTTVAKTGSGAPATGEVATITLSPTNNTNFTPGTYPGIFLAIGNGFSFTLVVAENGDLSATIISSNGGFTVGDSGVLNGVAIAGGSTGTDDITVTVASLTNIAYPTVLDLTKQVQKLTDGYYTLQDGAEGQVMYFVQQTGATGTARIYVSNCRIGGTVYIDNFIDPFAVGTNMVQMLFTDGAWQSIGGQWD